VFGHDRPFAARLQRFAKQLVLADLLGKIGKPQPRWYPALTLLRLCRKGACVSSGSFISAAPYH
jgi:hypothetical protein